MKKLLCFVGCFVTSAIAATHASASTNVGFSGMFEFQGGTNLNRQKSSSSPKFYDKYGSVETSGDKITNNNKDLGLYSKAYLALEISRTQSLINYGAKIVVNTTAKGSSLAGSHLFFESIPGRLELGSNLYATNTMTVSPYSISAATGDGFIRFANLLPEDEERGTISSYLTGYTDYSLIYDGLYEANMEKPRGITYYSPKILGLQAGVTYVPDTTNFGSSGLDKNTNEIITFNSKSYSYNYYNVGIANLLAVASTYEIDATRDLSFKFGAGFEHGQTKTHYDSSTPALKFRDLKSYNVGVIATYGNYSSSLSFADLGKSLTYKGIENIYPNVKNRLYSAGAAYDQGPYGLSLTYLNNDKFNGTLRSLTLGAQYKLVKNLTTYAELTRYEYKQKGTNQSYLEYSKITKGRNAGSIVILGTKLSF
ncbi:MAG: porin [Rickettsiaceae bacterium]|nr:porin [Rickettsiaceae bacterium]